MRTAPDNGSGNGRRRRVGAAVLAVAALVATAASGLACGGSSEAELRALQDDPLGRYAPPGGRLVRTDAAEEESGGIFSKATPATFRRLYALPPDGGPAAMQAAVDAARSAGWSVESVPGLGATGRKRLDSGTATMSISLLTDAKAIPGDTPPPVLSIALEHSR